jgi:hypothetical protein
LFNRSRKTEIYNGRFEGEFIGEGWAIVRGEESGSECLEVRFLCEQTESVFENWLNDAFFW